MPRVRIALQHKSSGFGQESRIRGQSKLGAASRWDKSHGYSMLINDAVATGDGPCNTSAGVFVAANSKAGFAREDTASVTTAIDWGPVEGQEFFSGRMVP